MNRLLCLAVLVSVSLGAEQVDKVSEAFGHMIGRRLDNPGISFDLEAVIRGLRKGAAGQASPMTEDEYEEVMAKIQSRAFEKVAKENLVQAERYLSENAKTDGVVEVEKGRLQYRILTAGKGPAVKSTSTPLLHYSGRYLDGTVFSSSDETGGAIELPLEQTIAGFSQAVVGMREGEKREIVIHPALAYGTTGHLPPNSLLLFDVEIVESREEASEEPPAPEAAVELKAEVSAPAPIRRAPTLRELALRFGVDPDDLDPTIVESPPCNARETADTECK